MGTIGQNEAKKTFQKYHYGQLDGKGTRAHLVRSWRFHCAFGMVLRFWYGHFALLVRSFVRFWLGPESATRRRALLVWSCAVMVRSWT